jgi:lipid-A-disaccharide synthase
LSKIFYLVAGEASGDILGARLIQSLKSIYPDALFKGIGGALMQAEGFQSLFAMERLSIMGIIPILKRMPELLIMRSKLANQVIVEKADCFIGIDAPEFNLGLELKLKHNNIKTVHYVSPSVWAWRENRIFKIAKSVDLMLCLFPFELSIYEKHKVNATCIGHPLANEIALEPNKYEAREMLGLSQSINDSDDIDRGEHDQQIKQGQPDELIVALLPGSRGSEVKYLIEPFIQTAQLLQQKFPRIQFILPCANDKRREQIEVYLNQTKPSINLKLIDGKSRQVMQAADVVMLASGTATLEALLLKKPMLVAYKMSDFSLWIFKKLLKIKNYSLPNLLAGDTIVREMIQQDCRPDLLSHELVQLIDNKDNSPQVKRFTELHKELQLGGSDKAAKAIEQLLQN